MNYLDFLDTAKMLIDRDNPTEADIRTAISRSYYAVFHHILLWWKSNARFPNYRDRAHSKLQMALFNSGIPTVRDFSRDLKNLNSSRQDADYDLTLIFDLAHGRDIFNLARDAITAFDAFDKAALQAGIEDYLKKINEI